MIWSTNYFFWRNSHDLEGKRFFFGEASKGLNEGDLDLYRDTFITNAFNDRVWGVAWFECWLCTAMTYTHLLGIALIFLPISHFDNQRNLH